MRRQTDFEALRPFAFDVLNAAILLVIVWGVFSLSAGGTLFTSDFEFNDPILAGGSDEVMLASLPATDSLE